MEYDHKCNWTIWASDWVCASGKIINIYVMLHTWPMLKTSKRCCDTHFEGTRPAVFQWHTAAAGWRDCRQFLVTVTRTVRCAEPISVIAIRKHHLHTELWTETVLTVTCTAMHLYCCLRLFTQMKFLTETLKIDLVNFRIQSTVDCQHH